MTTHLRARAAQAGALLALVVGGVAAAPAVALAAPPGVQINNLSPTDVLAGGQIQLQYTVTNPNNGGGGGGGGGGNNSANIKVTGMSCNGDCSQVTQIDPNGNKQFNAKLTAPQVAAGATQSVTVNISVTIGNEQNSVQQQVTVRGADKPQTVTAITGKVKDSDGKAISGASVAARDSNGNTFSATTNGSGSFSINSSDSKPITPGAITVAAGKNGYVNASVEVTGSAGKTVNVPLTLKLAAASASASPSASSSDVPSAPAGAGLDTNVPSQLAVQPSDGTGLKNASQNGSSSSTLFIVLGGLLVAAGIGAIVLVLMRRRNAAGHGGDDGLDPTAMGGGPGVIPPSQGRFNDATRVASPVAAGPATMIAPRSGAPSMADAPTMIHRPVPAVEDEFPDPYGAVLPPGGGYAGTQAGGWDDQPAAGAYGAPNQYGPAEDDYPAGQYGGGQGGYGGGQYGAAAGAPAAAAGPERFDEHTSLYQPGSDQDGYGDYGQNGYGPGGDAGQYGGAGQAGGAYGGGAGGAGQYGGGAYGGAAGGGQYGAGTAAGGGQYGGAAYSGRADEDYRPGGAYQGGGGYGPEPADQGGYGSPAGGIDSGNGYGPQGGAAPGGAGQYGGTYGGGAAAGAGGYGGGPQYGGGYDERGGYDQGQPAGGEYGPPANGPAPQQYGGGYDQYDEQNSAGYTGGRRGAAGYDDQHQQPSRRGSARRPDDY